MNDDLALLRDYARNHSEDAFAALVSRHVNLVYSVALRQAGDAGLAEEITQAAFIILARKAGSLGDKTILSGWLCRTARYAGANALTMQRRRQRREQEAFMQNELLGGSDASSPGNEETWRQIGPLLDAALEKLGEKDHDALVLRFFENRNFAEVGLALGATESAAKMRVSRALEKLKNYFSKRGVDSTADAITRAIAGNAIQLAPTGLAAAVTATAKSAAASTSTLTLVKGALKIMAWTKMKTAIAAGVAVVLATTTSTVVIKVAKSNQPPPKLETWVYKTDPAVIMNLRAATKSPSGTPAPKIFMDYFISKGISLRLPESVAFNGATGLLLVKATPADQSKIENLIAQLNMVRPQVVWKARFIRVPESDVAMVLKSGTTLTTTNKNVVAILDEDHLSPLLKQLSSDHAGTLAEPQVVTSSGRQSQMRVGDTTMDLVPTVYDDSYTIKLEAIGVSTETLTATANIWDGQTLVMGSQKTDSDGRLFIFLTTTVVDPAGNRIHAQDQMPLRPGTIPQQ